MPVAEAVTRAQASLRLDSIEVSWSSKWNATLDAALEKLPELEGCPRTVYRELLKPTSRKLHALVHERGAPIAVISLRERKLQWEPVAYQCLPHAIAPATSHAALGRALRALGVEVEVSGVDGKQFAALGSMESWAYDIYQVDLRSDYEAHWRAKKRQLTIRRARRHLAESDVRIDGVGDLEWIVNKWADQWAADPGQEIVAAGDRLNFWKALAADRTPGAYRLHTLMIVNNGSPVGGLVFTSKDGVVMAQCGGREPSLDDGYVAAAFTVGLIEWAKGQGYETFDLAGGEYKRHWGPVGEQRYGVIVRPLLLRGLHRLISE
jgi:hypothetical protein